MFEYATSNIKEIHIYLNSNGPGFGRLWYQEFPNINSYSYFRSCDDTPGRIANYIWFITKSNFGSIDVHNTFHVAK